MPRARTISCLNCGTRLRVRSLESVGEFESCPECKAALKPAADQCAANERAAKAEPVHPALVESPKENAGPSPKAIAASVTAILGLGVALAIIADPAESDTTALSGGDFAAQHDGNTESSGSSERSSSLQGPLDRQNAPSAPKTKDSASLAVSDISEPSREPIEPKVNSASPENQLTPSETEKTESIVEVKSSQPENGNPGQPTDVETSNLAKPVTPPRVQPSPPSLDERLDAAIAKFRVKEPTEARSLLEMLELMADVEITLAPAAEQAVLDRKLSFSLEQTSPRGIMREIANQLSLSASFSADRVTLLPATE